MRGKPKRRGREGGQSASAKSCLYRRRKSSAGYLGENGKKRPNSSHPWTKIHKTGQERWGGIQKPPLCPGRGQNRRSRGKVVRLRGREKELNEKENRVTPVNWRREISPSGGQKEGGTLRKPEGKEKKKSGWADYYIRGSPNSREPGGSPTATCSEGGAPKDYRKPTASGRGNNYEECNLLAVTGRVKGRPSKWSQWTRSGEKFKGDQSTTTAPRDKGKKSLGNAINENEASLEDLSRLYKRNELQEQGCRSVGVAGR